MQALCLSALALPGMLGQARADADQEAGYQYSHYAEGNRDIYTNFSAMVQGHKTNSIGQVGNLFHPITVDSEHGYFRFRPTEQLRFNVDYNQDLWSGASPISTAPASAGGNNPHYQNGVLTGATPLLKRNAVTKANVISGFFTSQGEPLLETLATAKGAPVRFSTADRLQQTLGYASPEMRNQIDFKLGYDWQQTSLDWHAGASIERDYTSRYSDIGGRVDFNRKQTTLNYGMGYTNSDTRAVLDEGQSMHISTAGYPGQYGFITDGQTQSLLITGNRQDGNAHVGLSQIISRNAVATAGFAYTYSEGYLSNPYKDVSVFLLKPDWQAAFGLPATAFAGVEYAAGGVSALEKRPGVRNQFSWDGSYTHYVEALDASAQLRYNFFHDDWGINAHTFDGEWRQALGAGWMLVPRVRYYSQTAAYFFAPYLFSTDASGNYADLAHRVYSSDQRLSAFGALSGGIVVSKQIAEGLTVDLGFDYYSRASALQIGGSGSGDYMDYHYFAGNAGIRANLEQLARVGQGFAGGNSLDWLDGLFAAGQTPDPAANAAPLSPAAPSGVQFGRMLARSGGFALGYRLLHDNQDGAMLHGTQPVGINSAGYLHTACPLTATAAGGACSLSPSGLTGNTHQVELLYAPTAWLNLLLMPQFVSAYQTSNMLGNAPRSLLHIETRDYQYGGGLGDFGSYALVRLWQDAGQTLHIGQGFTAPTGSIDNKSGIPGNYYPYNLQAGSGTWDYRPSLTYSGNRDAWSWGGQLNGTVRMQDRNDLGYRLGDLLQTTAWGGYQWNRWLGGTLRAVYTAQGGISGAHPLNVSANPKVAADNIYYFGSNDSPQNYGGDFADLGFGVNLTVPEGRFAGHRLGFEWLQPVYTRFNGYQLDRTGALAATWSYGF